MKNAIGLIQQSSFLMIECHAYSQLLSLIEFA
jgi:hypothetical protein